MVKQFNLSEKIEESPSSQASILYLPSVKEFINQIKATMLLTPSPTERGEFIVWLGREINKLAGKDLI